jgi:hypothetical protein
MRRWSCGDARCRARPLARTGEEKASKGRGNGEEEKEGARLGDLKTRESRPPPRPAVRRRTRGRRGLRAVGAAEIGWERRAGDGGSGPGRIPAGPR